MNGNGYYPPAPMHPANHGIFQPVDVQRTLHRGLQSRQVNSLNLKTQFDTHMSAAYYDSPWE